MAKGGAMVGRSLALMVLSLSFVPSLFAAELSPATEECIDCHSSVTPGIVSSWRRSRHARISPREALKGPELSRRISARVVPEEMGGYAVGCAECHTLRAGEHRDTFEHNGYQVHAVVSPPDCAQCHPVEVEQYQGNLMAHAWRNLTQNPVYQMLMEAAGGLQVLIGDDIAQVGPDEMTRADSCLSCHGTKISVKGFGTRETPFGEMIFPVLEGWPNGGPGRANPDGSEGSCTPCHHRHSFSIEEARKPHTCSTCHKGPDVPAYKVYTVSRHGTLYASSGKEWDFEAVPWVVGRDFEAPTCATCHISLLVDPEGEVLVERTHRMADRLPWRIFGLIYAHPHPKDADTTLIHNSQGLSLPTDLTGEPSTEYLISGDEQFERQERMERVCSGCHSREWIKGHFARLERAIETTNELTLTATKLILRAWEKGVVKGLDQESSPFDEALERKWVESWLFYANSTRYASAMAGADYGVFARGRWYLGKTLREMKDWIEVKGRR